MSDADKVDITRSTDLVDNGHKDGRKAVADNRWYYGIKTEKFSQHQDKLGTIQ